MSFLKRLFGGTSSSSQKGMLVCQNSQCREQYHLDHIVTVSDDQLMGWLTGGGATVVGKMSGHPVLVGQSKNDTAEDDLETLLNDGPKLGWQCNKCKTKNSWGASYRRE